MPRYRTNLPQLHDDVFLTDGGLETTLIYHHGFELPHFAAFHLLKDESGCSALQKYYEDYARLATLHNVGLILDSPTWRANPDWATKLEYTDKALAEANRKSISMLKQIRDQYENERSKFVISGCIGPRGDGYNPKFLMNEDESEQYHKSQIETFSETDADMITALTINYVEEAVGIVRAAKSVDMPVAISFTVETDGRLVTGQSLQDAIEYTDKVTDMSPAYYMINCAHPNHFEKILADNSEKWNRLKGIRANASSKSHAELDQSDELDRGSPVELASQYKKIKSSLNHLNILGGCCGTDYQHIRQICDTIQS